MLWLPAVSAESEQVATPTVDGVTAAQPAIVDAPSLKTTVPVRPVLPDGIGMVPVNVTVWLTMEVFPAADEVSVMLAEAAFTVSVELPLLVKKLVSLP